MQLKPNPKAAAPAPLVLDGDGLTLVALTLDGEALAADRYVATPDSLTIAQPPQRPFTLEIETVLDPSANTQLMGLYRSGATYCTQCEAEGFRRITYFPDRPDVMAVYTTRIEADKAECPVLLANGNPVASGDVAGTGRHFAVWHDPFPKPSYLFALVGGNLACVEDTFRTMSGRDVTLRIFVEPGKEDRCAYAMDSLKRSMRWDEETVRPRIRPRHFHDRRGVRLQHGRDGEQGPQRLQRQVRAGLAPRPQPMPTTWRIEAVIAHEYFHNWTGNRITCRDWFQLCLKEGLTVFRDQEFRADQRSRPVERIRDVRGLRAHAVRGGRRPPRPSGAAERLSRDQQFLHGDGLREGRRSRAHAPDAARRDQFPQGHGPLLRPPRRRGGDGRSVRAVLRGREPASISAQFMLWYSQAGTPEVVVSGTPRCAQQNLPPGNRADACRRRRASRQRSRC